MLPLRSWIANATTHSGYATFCFVTAFAEQTRSNAKRRNTLVVMRKWRVMYSLRAMKKFI
ncbi:hypothetical protein EHR06_07850 [Leptospira dzoumogneensis]|uniref:Uncharacterized protein n=1 Tax=Leptospira dzoumogneensis TaxID=2484904 RepID=A0A4Z1AJW3_9LEPT|nr:hypothetical protein EHR06_07850 [Leptospira dzoumogneensis]